MVNREESYIELTEQTWIGSDGGDGGDEIVVANTTDTSGSGNRTAPFIHLLPDNEFAVTVNGFLLPVVVMFTAVTNILVCVVLLKPNMRTATNTILVAMAISNILTGIWSVPCYLYFYVGGFYRDYLPFRWCFPYYCLTDFLPTIFHTASIWLTVALAVQRYICVCRSVRGKDWCTVGNAVRVAVVITFAAFLSQITHFFDYTYYPIMAQSKVDPDLVVEGCGHKVHPFFLRYADVYFNAYYIFRVVFIHLVSCVVLVVMNALLIQTMRVAQRRRNQLLIQNRKTECRRLAESNGTTMMLVVVVGVFFLVEFPQSILMSVMISAENNVHDIDRNAMETASMLANLIIMFSFSINFFIYCAMSTQFRNTFKELFTSGKRAVAIEETRRGSEMESRIINGNKTTGGF